MKTSQVHASIAPANCIPLALSVQDVADAATVAALPLLGIHITTAHVREMQAWAGDDTVGLQTTASIPAAVQFLQAWLPGFVRTLTQARKIDQLIGVDVVGAWEDEEVIQGVIEPTGGAVPYGDTTPVPFANWNTQYERRTVIRFEQGFQVGKLDEARAGRMRINMGAEKRSAAGLALDIQRNRVGFVGYNAGANRTYGFLNDPSLPAYVAAANGAGGSPTWASKTFLEIIADIRAMAQRLRTASGDNIDPAKDATTLAVATAVAEYFGVVSEFGISVRQWIKETYPAMTIESAPELNAANGGANVAYMYPSGAIEDGASDNRRVWSQLVPTKFMTVGVARDAKGYVEDYTNALAGVMCKRPYAVQRLTGI